MNFSINWTHGGSLIKAVFLPHLISDTIDQTCGNLNFWVWSVKGKDFYLLHGAHELRGVKRFSNSHEQPTLLLGLQRQTTPACTYFVALTGLHHTRF